MTEPTLFVKCSACEGMGLLPCSKGLSCPVCQGDGLGDVCPSCRGEGYIPVPERCGDDGLRERIRAAILAVARGCFVCEGDGEPGTCVGVNKVADAVLVAIAETHVVIERQRWERIHEAAYQALCEFGAESRIGLHMDDLDPVVRTWPEAAR